MATASVEFDCPSGLTLRFAVYAIGADTALAIGAGGETYVTATEKTNDTGCYTASVVDLADGTYRARMYLADGTTIARGMLMHVNATRTESVGPHADVWQRVVTESYGTAGAGLTAAQLLHLILAHVSSFSLATTVKTIKKLDGTTSAGTYTLDSATRPTSVVRAT